MSKEEISKAAIHLFLEKGYSHVTIQDICDEIKITKPTFYNYISSKEELILDLYDVTISSLVSNTYQLVDVDTHYEQLLVIFSTLIRDTKKYGYDLFSQMFIANLKENYHSFDMRDNLTTLCILIIKKAQDKKEILNTSSPLTVSMHHPAITVIITAINWKNWKKRWQKHLIPTVVVNWQLKCSRPFWMIMHLSSVHI